MKLKLAIYTLLVFTTIACSTPEKKEVKFEWDFKANKELVYAYNQEVTTQARFSKDAEITPMSSSVNFDLVIDMYGGNQANLSMINANLLVDGKPVQQEIPDIMMQKMDKNGNFDTQNADALFDILMALPRVDLKKGESDVVDLTFPFVTPDSTYLSEGINTIKFERMETIDSSECAVLSGVIAFGDTKSPESMGGNYEFVANGTATYYFDVALGCYKKAKIDMQMSALWDAEMLADTSQQVYGFSEIDMHSVYEINLNSRK